MKKILFFVLPFLFLWNTANARFANYGSGIALDDDKVVKYKVVQIYCGETFCMLYCYDPDELLSLQCTWANATWCQDCNDDMFNDGDGQFMFNYAMNQINQGNFEGTYYNDIYIEATQSTIYRTVSWNTNLTIQHADISLTMYEP